MAPWCCPFLNRRIESLYESFSASHAQELYNSYSQGVSLSSSCKLSLMDFVCAEVYPRCPYAYPCMVSPFLSTLDTMYWTVCKSECDVLQSKCGVIPNLNCSRFADNPYECLRLMTTVLLCYSIDSSRNSKFRFRALTAPRSIRISCPPSFPLGCSCGGSLSTSNTASKAPLCTPSSPFFSF